MTSSTTSATCDVLIVGGGLGGVAAALAAAARGRRVVISEPTRWLGGQLTTQGVPPDEHPWIEKFGSTRRYRQLRQSIRAYYQRHYPLTAEALADPELNPGEGKVSRLCHEPRVAAAVIDQMIAPLESGGLVRVLREHRLRSIATDGDRITGATFDGPLGAIDVEAAYVLDATELGDVLELGGVEHVTGFESNSVTGEPSAPDEAQPDNMQAFSWCFAVDHVDGADLTIDRPASYDTWKQFRPDFWPGPWLSLSSPHPRTLEPVDRTFIPNLPQQGRVVADQSKDPGDDDLWVFRRILSRRHFREGQALSDVCLVNWVMLDYIGGPLIGVTEAEAERHLVASRDLSRSVLYWLQTEAPRPDGGTGWKGLRLRGDVMGTQDGLAMAPYIRESRRIRSEYTIVEQDLAYEVRGDAGAKRYADSVGVGAYRIDLHPSTGGDNYIDVASCPYEIPMGALVPVRIHNLLAAGKSIGTTHITNGCYRLHPTEWNIGEAAGALAAFCLARGASPTQVRADQGALEDFRAELELDGFELSWPQVRGY